MTDTAGTGCCPRFDPAPWDEQEVEFDDRLFVRDRVRCLFHIPLNFGRVMQRNMTRIVEADAAVPDGFTLTDDNSLWGADVYLAVTKEVPGLRHERLSGTFFCKAFEGPYSKVHEWHQQMIGVLKRSGRTGRKLYSWYTTCPRCAKAYGKNPVVILAQL